MSYSIASTSANDPVVPNSGGIFANQFVSKYTSLSPALPPLNIYKLDNGQYLPMDDPTAIPEYQVAHVNDKIQLTSMDPRNSKHTIIAYHKAQRIDIRNSPELFPDSALLDTIPLEWYSNYAKNNLYDIKLPNGKIYRWWSPGQSSGVLQLIDKSEDSAGQDTLIAEVALNRNKNKATATLVISITHAIYNGGTGLTEDIVILSTFGVLKKCEKSFMHSAWHDGGKTVMKNGIMRFAARGADILFSPPIV